MGINILADMGDMKTAFPITVVVVNRAFLGQKRSVVKQFMAGYRNWSMLTSPLAADGSFDNQV